MSLLYIFIIPDDPFAVKILFKLIPMWLILYYAFSQATRKKSATHWLLLSGLTFCMFGDGLLVWFIVGLTAFLIGHLFYSAAFLSRWKFSLLRFLMIIPITLYGFIIGKEIINAILLDGNNALVLPVSFYIIVISLMAWSAIMTGNKWAIAGSILFVISDSILSWNMFVSDITHSGVLIMTTYYGAQFLIATSIRNVEPDKKIYLTEVV
jgi:uncharacterized membrane protein YhhN